MPLLPTPNPDLDQSRLEIYLYSGEMIKLYGQADAATAIANTYYEKQALGHETLRFVHEGNTYVIPCDGIWYVVAVVDQPGGVNEAGFSDW